MKELKRFLETHTLTYEQARELLDMLDRPEYVEVLQAEAVKLRKRYYGNKVYTRGLIEFTNYCRNNCYYCGIRCGNRSLDRYRMTEEEILACCREGYRLGYRTFVLQGGEDPWFSRDRMADIIRRIRHQYPDCAITLSVGERSRETYRVWKEAGADRYLLRHETADDSHYRTLHPASMSPENRKECLYPLKELGYQVGAGFMVGSPGQTREHLAEDLVFLGRLRPQMVGIGPFIPHHATPYAREEAGSVDLTLKLLAVIRVLLPKVLLPATTALGTLDPLGREKGLAMGANVVMPNLSPTDNRALYELYDNKVCVGDEAAKCRNCLEMRVKVAGYELVGDRGDYRDLPICDGYDTVTNSF